MAALQHNSHQAPQKVTFEAVASRLKTEARNEYDDPGGSRVRAMFRKWMRAHQSCEAFGSAIASRDIEDGQRFDALFAEMVDQVEGVIRAMVAAPSSEPRDVLMKIAAATNFGERNIEEDDDDWRVILAEMRRFVTGRSA